MAEMVLPGVYIEVRPEALIVPGAVTVGNIGIVGTARRGPIGEVKVLGSYAEAREVFGAYDAFDSPETANRPLTMVRALQLAYANGASTVLAVRVGKDTPAQASHKVASRGGTAAILTAKTPGTWGNDIAITVEAAVSDVKVILRYGAIEEIYTVSTGDDLVEQIITADSALVDAKTDTNSSEKPKVIAETKFVGGDNGADTSDVDYEGGFEQLLHENAHIIVAAGQDDTIGNELTSHVEIASTDEIKRDRIAVVGSKKVATLGDITGHNLASDRVIFVAPGIKATDAPSGKEVTLPGAYAAAAIAGMLSARDPHVNLTNKTVSVGGLETKFTPAQLKQLVQKRVLALEERRGFRVVKAITTDDGAFRQISTRRIVDFAKFGARSAASPYIGLLNNDRVRKALKGSINGFMAGMVDDEMIISYELDVTATRDEEIRGIAKVTMTVRPTFSIDFIKVVMFLG